MLCSMQLENKNIEFFFIRFLFYLCVLQMQNLIFFIQYSIFSKQIQRMFLDNFRYLFWKLDNWRGPFGQLRSNDGNFSGVGIISVHLHWVDRINITSGHLFQRKVVENRLFSFFSIAVFAHKSIWYKQITWNRSITEFM